MLRMAKLTDYGIVLMSYLAENTATHHNAHTLSEAVRVPLPTVRKVLKALSQYGLLDSERGAHGGYSLNKAPRDISAGFGGDPTRICGRKRTPFAPGGISHESLMSSSCE